MANGTVAFQDEAEQRTSQLWEEGTISSSFFPLKISMPTKWHLAWPCLPVLEVETSTTYKIGNDTTKKTILVQGEQEERQSSLLILREIITKILHTST